MKILLLIATLGLIFSYGYGLMTRLDSFLSGARKRPIWKRRPFGQRLCFLIQAIMNHLNA